MGTKVVGDLADYLKRQNPRRRGLSKRNLYNMVKFYDVYSRPIFIDRISQLNINEFVQLQTAQIQDTTIVQLPTAQLETTNNKQIPALLTITTFTNHVEIMNRCRNDEERIFYMLYAFFHIHPIVYTLLQLRHHGSLFVERDIELNVLIGIFEVHKGAAVPSHFPVGRVFNRESLVLIFLLSSIPAHVLQGQWLAPSRRAIISSS